MIERGYCHWTMTSCLFVHRNRRKALSYLARSNVSSIRFLLRTEGSLGNDRCCYVWGARRLVLGFLAQIPVTLAYYVLMAFISGVRKWCDYDICLGR
jgi:hypothetical protein